MPAVVVTGGISILMGELACFGRAGGPAVTAGSTTTFRCPSGWWANNSASQDSTVGEGLVGCVEHFRVAIDDLNRHTRQKPRL
jgi:hypothetical protein